MHWVLHEMKTAFIYSKTSQNTLNADTLVFIDVILKTFCGYMIKR